MYLGITEAFTAQQLLEAYNTELRRGHRVNRAVLPVLRRQGAGLLLWNGSGTTRAIPPFLDPYSAAGTRRTWLVPPADLAYTWAAILA